MQVAALLGWDAMALAFLAFVWRTVAGKDNKRTAELASANDVYRLAADAILIAATIVSLFSVGVVWSGPRISAAP